jgi:methyl-accepting chemotaxis protein
MGREPINGIVLVAYDGRVLASGESSQIGETTNNEAITQALLQGQRITRTTTLNGQSELSAILPIMNRSECNSCHSQERMVLGAIEVDLDYEPVNNYMGDQTRVLALIGGLTLLGVWGTLSVMLRLEIISPLSNIAETARRITQGDLGARTNVTSKDEVGVVAHTFDEMAERIEHYTSTLEDSHGELEAEVQKRTQELQKMAVVRGQLLDRVISAQEEDRQVALY